MDTGTPMKAGMPTQAESYLAHLAHKRLRGVARTGIAHTPGRQQEYAVWYRGFVIQFCSSELEAESVLEKLRKGRA